MKGNKIIEIEGYAINDDEDHWTADCPNCGKTYEWEGYFDSSDIEFCRLCRTSFQVKRVWFDNGKYID